MQTRKLGNLEVSAIGLGCMRMSAGHGSVAATKQEMIALLRGAVDRGINFFDTAEVYGPFVNEQLVGEALAPVRDQVVIATKFGNQRREDGSWIGINGRPEYVRQACDASLTRLQADHIDLYYQHRIDPKVPIEDVWGELSLLVREGKVRYVGMSEPGIETLRRAHAIHPVAAVQSEYSLFTREPEEDLMPVLEELGIGLVPFAPLGRGMLSGTIRTPDDFAPDDFRRRLPRYQGEAFYKNLELVDKVVAIAADRGATPAQLAIAWILSRRSYIVPIPGMETRALLRENLKAADLELTQDELAAIEAVIPHGGYGDRYGQYGSLQKAEAGK